MKKGRSIIQTFTVIALRTEKIVVKMSVSYYN